LNRQRNESGGSQSDPERKEKRMKNNIACRLFKEQIDLINALPEKERPQVLYAAIMNAFNQFENQFDNQFEKQNENAYISVSVSDIGNSIIKLLSKNIVVKEFSTNYGGRRPNAGKKAADHVADVSKMVEPAPQITPEEKAANREKAQQIIQQTAQVTKRQPDQISITYNDVIVHGLLGKFLKDNFGEDTVTRARDWMIDHVAGQNWNATRIIKLMCKWTGKSPFTEINKWADFCEEYKNQNKNQNNS
jgi:hypothetical protein